MVVGQLNRDEKKLIFLESTFPLNDGLSDISNRTLRSMWLSVLTDSNEGITLKEFVAAGV
jgi:hypothetical protein